MLKNFFIRYRCVSFAACLLALCLLVPYGIHAGDAPPNKPADAVYKRLAGKWLRPDGGYVLELKDVKPDGRITAAYFNPKPINVSKAEWRQDESFILLAVELRDVNYPGSAYALVYLPKLDRLSGYYYQAVLNQTFEVVFIRTK